MCGVERETGDSGRAQLKRESLVQLDQFGQARERVAGVALDLGCPGSVTEDEDVRRRAVDQAERHPGVRGMHERALALDEEQLPAALVALDDETFCSAGEKVGDDGVDRDSPAGDR